MKRLLTIIACFLVMTAGAQKIINDPNAEPRSATGFKAIHVSGGFDVYLSQGDEGLAVSASDKKYLEYIETKVENGVLIIRYTEKGWMLGNRKLKAYVSAKELSELKGSGATDFTIAGTMALNALHLNLSGASDLKGNLVVKGLLDAHLSGASDLKVSGSAQEVRINASGASDVKGYDFTTALCKVDASGASGVKIAVEKELSVSLSGASSVNYKGNAVIRDIKTSGASSVSRKS